MRKENAETEDMFGYRPRTFLSVAEVPYTDPPLGERLPAADTASRPTNGLSAIGVDELWASAVKCGRLRPVTLTTGGRDPVEAWASILTSGGQSQFNVSTVDCPTARADLVRVYQGPDSSKQLKINIAQLAWRKLHPTADNLGYRLLPINLEISHQAEAYHRPGVFPGLRADEQYTTGYKVELSNLEAQEINESRKFCVDQALMWCSAETGELIPQDEIDSFDEPTCCIHASYGVPCYAPYPVEGLCQATLVTPHKHRGKRSRTGTGSKAARAL